MSLNIQEEQIWQLIQQSGESVSLVWLCGEPTLMRLDFYKRAIDLKKTVTTKWLETAFSPVVYCLTSDGFPF
jgi:sulfatase maturation enzyme AslB (radical SAM superfamily)